MDPMMMMMLLSLVGNAASPGKEGEFKSTYNPGQLDLINQMVGQLQGNQPNIAQNQNYKTGQEYLQGLYNDPTFFNKFEAPLMRQFQEEILPQIGAQYGGMGSHGSYGSAYQNAQRRAGENLTEKFAALRGNMQQQGVPQLLNYAQAPFQGWLQQLQQALQPTQNVYQGPNAGPFGDILSGLSSGAAQGYGQQWGQNMAGNGLRTNVSLPEMARGISG